jgi:hypothetical protein
MQEEEDTRTYPSNLTLARIALEAAEPIRAQREQEIRADERRKVAAQERDGWRERAETAEPAIARVRSLVAQLEAEAEQGLKTSVLDSQRAAWSAQLHVTGLFLAALDDTAGT